MEEINNKNNNIKNKLIKKKVIIDTNLFLLPGLQKINIFEELKRTLNQPLELITFNKNINELKKIAEKNTKEGFAAKLGLKLIEDSKKKENLKIVNISNLYADDAILWFADKNKGAIVATLDRELKKKLLKKRISVITVVQKKFFKIIKK